MPHMLVSHSVEAILLPEGIVSGTPPSLGWWWSFFIIHLQIWPLLLHLSHGLLGAHWTHCRNGGFATCISFCLSGPYCGSQTGCHSILLREVENHFQPLSPTQLFVPHWNCVFVPLFSVWFPMLIIKWHWFKYTLTFNSVGIMGCIGFFWVCSFVHLFFVLSCLIL